MPIPLRPVDTWAPKPRRNGARFDHAPSAPLPWRVSRVEVPASIAFRAIRDELERDPTADAVARGDNDGWPCLPLATR